MNQPTQQKKKAKKLSGSTDQQPSQILRRSNREMEVIQRYIQRLDGVSSNESKHVFGFANFGSLFWTLPFKRPHLFFYFCLDKSTANSHNPSKTSASSWFFQNGPRRENVKASEEQSKEEANDASGIADFFLFLVRKWFLLGESGSLILFKSKSQKASKKPQPPRRVDRKSGRCYALLFDMFFDVFWYGWSVL